MNRWKSVWSVFATCVVFWLLLFLPVARYITVQFGLEVGYARVVIVVVILSVFSVLAWAMFKTERLPVWVRVLFGYLFLLFGTLVVRRAMGVWLFRRFVALWLFALIIAVIYATCLSIVRHRQRKEEVSLNRALKNVSRPTDSES